MTTGLRTYNAAGQTLVDMTSNISQTMGSVVTGGATSGSVSMPGLPRGKTRFYIVSVLVDLQREKGKRPGVTISGNTLSWLYSYPTNGWGFFSANCEIFYGYY